MLISSTAMMAIGIVMAVWLAVAVWAITTGLSMRRGARGARRQLRRFTRLLDGAPALPLVVRVDGRLEGPDRLAKWLGLQRLPGYLSELDSERGGLASEDLAALSDLITRAQKSGGPFTMSFSVKGSERYLRVEGQLADPETVAPGAALLWIFDDTDSARNIRALTGDVEEAQKAFGALSGLIEAAPMPMWFRARDLSLMLVNTAYVRAVGASDAQEVLRDGAELLETVDGVSPLAIAAKAAETGEAQSRTVSVTMAGKRRNMLVVDLPLGDRGVAGYAVDVQDLEDARSEMEDFRAAQRDMLDNLSAGVAQFDRKRQLIFCNQPFQRLFALKPQWVQENLEFDRLLDRMREANRLPAVRDYPAWRAEHGDWFRATGALQENWLLADGTHLRAIAQPAPDGGLLLIFEDRTEQVQLASARDTLLRARTATFNNLFEALAVFTSDGRLHLWNNRFVTVWGIAESVLAEHPRADELLKKLAPGLKRPAHISALREVIRAATLDRIQRSGELVMKSGAIYNFTGLPLPDGNALFTMIDVTDGKRIENALRERNEALVEADAVKTRFLANMSYEFRTPLTSIGGFAEMLSSGIVGELSDQAKEYVQAIIQSVDRLSSQINNVLDLSQSEAGTLPLKLEKILVAPILDQCLADAGKLAAERQITLEANVSEELGEAMADRARLGQAIGAVLDNGLRYTQQGGRVLLHADRHRGKVRVIISDNGPGLDGRAQARALDGFALAEDQAASGQRKSGLGLPLARHLVEAHGGKLELVSEPGEGTMVTISLP
ncbi:MAG: PAS-domain containing protein [Blastomonas sp.]